MERDAGSSYVEFARVIQWAVRMSMQTVRVVRLLCCVVAMSCSISLEAADRFTLVKDDVVVLAGGTNMVRSQQAGYLETALTRTFASVQPKFRDLSWEADTVFGLGTVIERWRPDGFGNRDEQFRRVGTTVVISQFGQVESLAGREGLERFSRAYGELVTSWQKQARLVVLVTPSPFEAPPSRLIPDLSTRNDDLALYVKAISDLAGQRGLLLVDLFSRSRTGLTDNGMHIKPSAQPHVAHAIAAQLGVEFPGEKILEPLRQAVIEKHRLWYDYWRPANWKLLYGDDSRRQFTRGGANYIPFREEWQRLLPLIQRAEQRVWAIAGGKKDPGHNRPAPEVLHKAPQANIKAELASFVVPRGFRVNLFASDSQGLTSPIAMRWDPAGRMYVAVTTTYPHVFPGDVPDDKIICLEDTDGDGAADTSTVFARGLNIPTGMEWGDGGLYVGQNTEILFLEDTDDDGRADRRRVVLGGFGNGDSHQTINSFVWSPGGELYFGQGDGCESRVETPWGSSNLFQAGFYRFRPLRLQLDPLLDDFMGPGNPWGVAFNGWGQIFSIDGAGGVTYLSPGQVPTTHKLKLRRIGKPGGYCGIGYLDGRGVPESLRGDFVIGDFKPNRVKRFSVHQDGAGFTLQWKDPILQSRHRNFRPVDVKQGPDGAIYVVDWYNPITCHQDDAYRDPTRDKAHGRIWRLAHADSTPAVPKPPDLSKAPLGVVLETLKSPEHWSRYQAKRALTNRDRVASAQALDQWVGSLDPKDPRHEHHLYEALGAYETIETVRSGLLNRLLQATDHRARAYAARVTGRWHDRLDDPLARLAPRVLDEHPQVRMEALMACAAIPSPRSIEVVARVVDKPRDGWIDYAFKQAVHHLVPHWMPAFRKGQVSFQRPSHLAAVLNEVGGRDALVSLKRLLDGEDLDRKTTGAAISAVLAVGGPDELTEYGLREARFVRDGRYDAALHADSLGRLVDVARFRKVRPSGDLAVLLRKLITTEHAAVGVRSLELAGLWNVTPVTADILEIARNGQRPVPVREAAFQALVVLKVPATGDLLEKFSVAPFPLPLRSAAVRALASIDLQQAAAGAAGLFDGSKLEADDTTATLAAFVNRAGGARALAVALGSRKLKPDVARQLLKSLFSTGHSDRELIGAFNSALGASARAPDYSQQYVKTLVSEAARSGVISRGSVLFKSLACVSCHKVGGSGGTVGPDLTAIGTTLSPERIAEELLWPNRQVKEGFSAVQVVTEDGKIHQGYERKTKEGQASGDLVLEDPATKKLVTIKRASIEVKKVTGSVMPTGLTAVLSREQLLDLVRFLSELGKIR